VSDEGERLHSQSAAANACGESPAAAQLLAALFAVIVIVDERRTIDLLAE
jgi:hypothetical protein